MKKKLFLGILLGTALFAAAPARADNWTFQNTTALTLPDNAVASSYPSNINVSGLIGTIDSIQVTLMVANHTNGSDINGLLVGPQGQRVLLMSNACSGALTNVSLTFADSGPTPIPQVGPCLGGNYRPADYSPGCAPLSFPSPAPSGPYGVTFSAYNGGSPNGNWSLYLQDACAGGSGAITGGWAMVMSGPQNANAPGPKKKKKKKCKKKSKKKGKKGSAAAKDKKKSKCKKKGKKKKKK
jgi:subtilisin-like proprotein convertase family protein